MILGQPFLDIVAQRKHVKSGEWVRGLKMTEGKQAMVPFICRFFTVSVTILTLTTSRKITQPVSVSQPSFLASFVQFRVKLGVRVRVLMSGHRVKKLTKR